MRLFQTEWLREPAYPVAGSYANPAYGVRYARIAGLSTDIAIDLPAAPPPAREETRASSFPPFDRAA